MRDNILDRLSPRTMYRGQIVVVCHEGQDLPSMNMA